MKRLVCLVTLLMLALSVSSQVKKIAILETINREGDIAYSVKLMVRSNLTKAISNTPGYEGYDRVNMSQIMGEQDFQRTGMVNEEQIKRLGEICGADYIVVSEVAKVDASNIFVTATILNVETAQTIGAENALMAITASDIQHGCESLSNRLLGLPDNTTASAPSKTKQTSTSISDPKQKQKPQPQPQPQPQTPYVSADTHVGKTALGDLITFTDGTQGIVFYLDDSGNGLAVSLVEGDGMRWDDSRKPDDISGLANYEEDDHSFVYGQGIGNTQIIQQALGSNAKAANWCTSLGQGWYLPSAGELYYLTNSAKEGTIIYNQLVARGATMNDWYWSSTEHNKKEALNLSSGGWVNTETKKTKVNVRAIRAFSK